MEFKVGDKVYWNGLVGVVRDFYSINHTSPMTVDFAEEGPYSFTPDGKLLESMTEPCLKLVERPKKKVKIQVERWANVYEGDVKQVAQHTFSSEQDAKYWARMGRIACVKLTGEYEVEVDE